ncbi:site-specific integrase [Pseudomonas syringae]|uniref:site-specific integrase n=1 Tax=Pseudomonas syringae TaxID=317 RepID=UPI000A21E813|nr:site-specific integrase [Pseudomonas syringae]AYL17487.1 site-specific integrase [Pseudomonas syringae pv. actinidiae]OSR52037.1 hypothetical protein BV325_04856 [Pseudomonas syringae pv. actinidiae]OSR68993.1 hypothetical protein BV328_04826 [Pseudomonas syringae pv. actinidiae]OSR69234.1 hypothetical protein BV326_03519 [Pseudomonas syringae pv. actinidiae]
MPKYIEKSRHGLYYLRLPSRLAHLNDGKRISLKTHSKRLAITRASSHIFQIEQLMRNAMSLNPKDHEEIAFEEAVRAFAIDLDERNAKLDSILRAHPGPDAHEAIGLVSQQRLRNVMRQQASALISEQIRGGYLAPGLTLNSQNQIFHNLFQYAENVSIEITGSRTVEGTISAVSLAKAQKSYRELLYSAYLELCDAARSGAAITATNIYHPETKPTPVKNEATHTLLEIYDGWIQKHEDMNGETSFSTEQEYARHAFVLTVLSRHSPIESFTKEDFEKLHKLTLEIKAYAATGKHRPTLTTEMLIPTSEEYKRITPETASAYSRRLAALHQYAFQEGFTAIDPTQIGTPNFDKLTANIKRQQSIDETPKKSNTIAELKAIFDGWIYRPTKIHNNISVYPYQFWMPLIAAFSGMRIAEIAGLTPKDIEERNGIWCIRIEENIMIGKRVKTLSSKRLVPIHSRLKKLGFIDYVSSRKKTGSEMLFDGVSYNKKNGWGHAASTFFTRVPSKSTPGGGYFYNVGVHLAAHDGRDMHSFRHTLIDQLKNCGESKHYSQYIVESISGHQKPQKTEADHYGDELSLEKKAEYLERVIYEGLNLDHVSYESFTKAYSARIQRSLAKFNRAK